MAHLRIFRRVIVLAASMGLSCSMAFAGPAVTNAPAAPATNVYHWSTNFTDLFDGKSLTNWGVTDFGGHGPVSVEGGNLKIAMGDDLSGINWTNGALPKSNYEITLDGARMAGGDFFCGLTFPVADSSCSLILGGWGGGLVGLSSIDDQDASENETTRTMYFEKGRWYHIVLRVTDKKIQAWVDNEKLIDVSIVGRKISLRPGAIYMCEPLGIATYSTTGEIKNFKLRLVAP